MVYRRYSTDGRPQPVAEAEKLEALVSGGEVLAPQSYTDDDGMECWEVYADADHAAQAGDDGDPYVDIIREEVENE